MLLWLLLAPAWASTVVCTEDAPGCDVVGLQRAIERADPGDELEVRAGVYAENLVVEVSIDIVMDRGAVVIGAWDDDADHLVEVLGDEDGDALAVSIIGGQIGSEEEGPDLPRVHVHGASVELEGTRIEGGWSSTLAGAGAVLLESGAAVLRDCEVVGADSEWANGGAFRVGAGAAMSLVGGSVTDVSAASGAVAAVDAGGELVVDGTVISDARSASWASGGLFHVLRGRLELIDLELEGGFTYLGGVAYVDGGEIEITRCTLTGGIGAFGGGHLWAQASTVQLTDSVFMGGESGAWGGSVVADAHQGVTVAGCWFEGNTAALEGGAVFATTLRYDDASAYLDTTFRANSASDGGALALSNSGLTSVQGCRFEGNAVDGRGGGAIQVDGVSLSVDVQQNVFCDNRAAEDGIGGAIHLASYGWHHLGNNVFASNMADYGGAVEVEEGGADVVFNTFVGNTARIDGAGLKVGPYAFANTDHGVYADNTSPDTVLTVYGYGFSDWNGFWNNTAANATFHGVYDVALPEAPGFFHWDPADPCSIDARVGPDSPLVDAGSPDVIEVDGSRADLGAFGGYARTDVDSDGDGTPDVYDCAELDPTVGASVPERCNGVDDDCNGDIDDGLPLAYPDADGDGWGDADHPGMPCAPDGWVFDNQDCDDDAPDVHPGRGEVCNGIDDDCDGVGDLGEGAVVWWRDVDGDGWGAGEPTSDCVLPSGTVERGGDCDDSRADVFPGAEEYCDRIDQDCDGGVDDAESLDAVERLPDEDGDGFGVAGTEVRTCSREFGVEVAGDCDDRDPTVHPRATEVWYDGVDQDCDGADDFDADRDGFAAFEHGGDDCDDEDADSVPVPGAPDCDVIAETAWVAGGGGCDHGGGRWLPFGLLVALAVRRRR